MEPCLPTRYAGLLSLLRLLLLLLLKLQVQ